MATSTINLASASLEQLLQAADAHATVTLSRHGQEVAVIVPIDEWKRLHPLPQERESENATPRKRETMLQFLMRSPIWEEDLVIPEMDWSPRKLDL